MTRRVGVTPPASAVTVPPVDEGRMLRFLAAAGVGLAGVLAASLLLVLAGGRLDAAAGFVDPAAALRRSVPWLASALDGFSFVADIGRLAGWSLLPAVTVVLLIRRLQGPAGFVAVASAGAVLLGGTGALLSVAWRTGEGNPGDAAPDPVYDDVVGLTVAAVVGLLVLRPVLSARAGRWLITALAAMVVGFGVLAVASGLGGPVGVLGGWLVGGTWVIVASAAYRRWALAVPRSDAPLLRGLPVDNPAALRPAPARDRVPNGVPGVLVLVGAAVLITGAMLAVGMLVIAPSAAIQRFDEALLGWVVDFRTPPLTAVATMVDALGNTPGVLAVHLAAIPITIAITRHRAPAVFLLTALIGETAIYLAAGAIVGRDRPAVGHLGMTVPATSGYPSGHVAASLVTYGGIALLVIAWSRSRWRYAPLAGAVLLVLGVVWARLYWGMHYPTDTLVSLAYGAVWLAVCWWVIRPDRGSDRVEADRVEDGGG